MKSSKTSNSRGLYNYWILLSNDLRESDILINEIDTLESTLGRLSDIKYGKAFGYRNHAKLIFSANRIPDSDDTSYAYFKRWLILSFDKTFDGTLKDTDL